MEYATLNNGERIPLLGFGVFQVEDPAEWPENIIRLLLKLCYAG